MTHTRWNLITLLTTALTAAAALAAGPSTTEKQYREQIEQLLPGMAATAIPDRKDPQQKLEKLCHEAGAPGKEADREALSKAIMSFTGAQTAKPARVWLLRKIETLGNKEVVDDLAKLMYDSDPEIADLARRALANNPSDQALAALRKELAQATQPEWKVAMINALAWRHDAKSAETFVQLAKGDDAVSAAAISALGEVASDKAVKALADLRKSAPAETQPAVVDASLRAAERLRADGKPAGAKDIYEELVSAKQPERVRVAAISGLANTLGDAAVPELLKYATGDDAHLALIAARCLARVPGPKDADKQIAAALKNAKPQAQAMLIETLGDRGDKKSLVWVMLYMNDKDADVRLATYEAMGKLGTAPTAHVLIAQGAASAGPQLDVIRKSLAELTGPGVDEEIVKILKSTKDAMRREAIMAVWGRRITAAKPLLLDMAGDPDEKTRLAVLAAMERIANEADLPKLVEMLAADRGDECAKDTEKAITSVCRRAGDAQKCVGPLVAGMSKAAPAGQVTIIRLLGKIQGDAALAAVRTAAKSEDAKVRSAAEAALAQWAPAYITTWQVAGPFRQDGKGPTGLFDIAFPPETAGAPVEWKPLKITDSNEPGQFDLSQVDKGEDCCVYVKAAIESQRKQDVVLSIGSDDGVKVWLNGKVVHGKNVNRALKCGEDKVKVTLNEGENALLMKITQGKAQFSFCCGVQAEKGGPPAGVRFEAR